MIKNGKYRILFLRFCKEYGLLHKLSKSPLNLKRIYDERDLFTSCMTFDRGDGVRLSTIKNPIYYQREWIRFFWKNAFKNDFILFINTQCRFLKKMRKDIYGILKDFENTPYSISLLEYKLQSLFTEQFYYTFFYDKLRIFLHKNFAKVNYKRKNKHV